jgi:aerobic carbon-monoxide dehydrogenase medium subunit
VKTPPFEYHAPRSVDEVLSLLAEHGDEAKVLAGGQSLIPLLAMRMARPSQLVDINEVASLAGIRPLDGDGVAIGTLTREREAERSSLVAERIPVLAEALPHIGHVSIRNRGTVGGSLAHADALAELPVVAVVTDAELVVRSAGGERVVPAAEFFVGHFSTSMADDELLTEVRMPTGPAGAGWAFHEVARRHGDFALVGVAAMVRLDGGRIADARLAVMGVADRAMRLHDAERSLVGETPGLDTFAAAAADAVRPFDPPSDIHGSGDFRRHLAGVAVRRALATAASRAEGAS